VLGILKTRVEALQDLKSGIARLQAMAEKNNSDSTTVGGTIKAFIFAKKLLKRAHAPREEVATETCTETSVEAATEAVRKAAEVLRRSKAKAIEHAM